MGRQVEAGGLSALPGGEHMTMSVIESASATAVVIAIAVAAVIVPLPRPKPEILPDPPAAQDNVTEPQMVPVTAPPPPPPVPHLETPEHIRDVQRVQVIQLQVEEARRDVIEIAKSLRSKAEPEDARR